jgi:hypothetical protein
MARSIIINVETKQPGTELSERPINKVKQLMPMDIRAQRIPQVIQEL